MSYYGTVIFIHVKVIIQIKIMILFYYRNDNSILVTLLIGDDTSRNEQYCSIRAWLTVTHFKVDKNYFDHSFYFYATARIELRGMNEADWNLSVTNNSVQR